MISIDFQEVFNVIASTLPDEWVKTVIYCIRIDGSFDIKYYVKTVDCRYVDCFNLEVPNETMLNVLVEMCTLFSSDKDDWRSVTVMISSDGGFNAEADYSIAGVSVNDYIDNWKKKYLV